jgi:hypothetical protein
VWAVDPVKKPVRRHNHLTVPDISDQSVFEKRAKLRPSIEPPQMTELPRSLSYETVNKYRECEIAWNA